MKTGINLLEIYKFKKSECSRLFLFVFGLVIFESFMLGTNMAMSDAIYFVFLLLFLKKYFSKKNKKDTMKWFIYPVIFFAIAAYNHITLGTEKSFLSQMRFIYNCSIFVIMLAYVDASSDGFKHKVVNTYIYFCVICSTLVVIQFISYYLFHINLSFDWGSYGTVNAAAGYSSVTELYRSGGFFNEPSWFALYSAPVLDMTYREKKIKEMAVCMIGLILSTSNLGFLFVFIFMITKFSFKRLSYAFLFVGIIALVYFTFPIAFQRFFESFDSEGSVASSNAGRVSDPIMLVAENGFLLLGGVNLDSLYAVYEDIFLNTFIWVALSFGLIGLFFFLKLLYKKGFLCITLSLLAGVVVEGCYGRIDFWMMLLAASTYCLNTCKYTKTLSVNN